MRENWVLLYFWWKKFGKHVYTTQKNSSIVFIKISENFCFITETFAETSGKKILWKYQFLCRMLFLYTDAAKENKRSCLTFFKTMRSSTYYTGCAYYKIIPFCPKIGKWYIKKLWGQLEPQRLYFNFNDNFKKYTIYKIKKA